MELHPGGMPEISRWLSAATPPVFDELLPDPGGVAVARLRPLQGRERSNANPGSSTRGYYL